MSQTRHIRNSARDLVVELGEDAPRFAATRAHQLLKAGDSDGYALWNTLRLETYRQLWSSRPPTLPARDRDESAKAAPRFSQGEGRETGGPAKRRTLRDR